MDSQRFRLPRVIWNDLRESYDQFEGNRRVRFVTIVRGCKAFMGARMTGNGNLDQVGNDESVEIRDLLEELLIADGSTEAPSGYPDVWTYHIDYDEPYLNLILEKREEEVVTLEEACFKVCSHSFLEIASNSQLKHCLLNLPSHMINNIMKYNTSLKLQDPEYLSFVLQTSCSTLKLSRFPNIGSLPDLTKLTHLDIAGCRIPKDPYLQLVRNLPNVKILSLESTEAFDELLGILVEHSTLMESLNLKHNRNITDDGILYLCFIKDAFNDRQPRDSQLQTLEIKNTEVTKKGCFFAVWFLPHLIDLSFDRSFHVFRDFPREIKNRDSDSPFLIQSLQSNDTWSPLNKSQIIQAVRLCPNVTKVDIDMTATSPEILPVLANFEKLKHLTLRYSEWVEFDIGIDREFTRNIIAGFSSFLQIRGSTLTFLNLVEAPAIINLIGCFCPNLIELHLKRIHYKKAQPVVNQGKLFQNFTHLKVSTENYQLSIDDLNLLLYNCAKLKYLHMSEVHIITPAVLSEILLHNPMCSLESASFNKCNNINAECIEMLVDSIPSLKEVKISV